MPDERITRELTPMVEVLAAPQSPRSTLLLQTERGGLYEEDGRVIFQIPGATGRPVRLLVDSDADLFALTLSAELDRLGRCFEVHLDGPPPSPLPRALAGATVVVPWTDGPLGAVPDAELSVRVEPGVRALPPAAVEAQLVLRDRASLPTQWPEGAPTLAVVPITGSESVDGLPPLLHGMGAGRLPLREVRLRVDPRAFQLKDRRAPFLSEVTEAVASAVGCSTTQLGREIALRARLLELGMRRHLLPDPFFVTWLFRGHPTRGLVPATDHFPVPRRASRQEILRGTPESEHERLLSWLALLADPAPRLKALAARDLFAVSVHFLPNPDLPLTPNHGGIGRWDGRQITALA